MEIETTEFIKDCLKNKRKGVYNLIVKHHSNEINEFGVTLFVSYLINKYNLNSEAININSLRAAIKRKKPLKKQSSSFLEKNVNNRRDIDMDELGFNL